MKNTQGWVLRICTYLGIAVGTVVVLYLLNTYVIGYFGPNSDLALYLLEFMAVIIFCTCLILHRMGNLNSPNR